MGPINFMELLRASGLFRVREPQSEQPIVTDAERQRRARIREAVIAELKRRQQNGTGTERGAAFLRSLEAKEAPHDAP